MEEIWKSIEEYDKYEVSNKGRVRNKENKRLLTPYISNSGYYMINIRNEQGARNKTIHRLVAKAFISNFSNKEVVNHIDHDKLNNHVENLEWVTQKENCKHSISAGRADTKTARENLSKISSKAVYQKDMEGNIIKLWESPTQAMKESKGQYKANSIGRAANGGRKSYKGYKWEFVDKDSKRSRTLFINVYNLDSELIYEKISVNKAMKMMGRNSHVALKNAIEKSETENRKIEYNGYLVLKHEE